MNNAGIQESDRKKVLHT